jgi:hypothetical protein
MFSQSISDELPVGILRSWKGKSGMKLHPLASFRNFSAVLCLILVLLSLPSVAYGYADPGTGAFLYQAAYAAVLGGTYYLRKFLNRFRKRGR